MCSMSKREEYQNAGFLDQTLHTEDGAEEAIIDLLYDSLSQTEAGRGRQKKKFKEHIRVVFLNMCWNYHVDPQRYTAYSRDAGHYTKSRYGWMGYKPMRAVWESLHEREFVDGVNGYFDSDIGKGSCAKMRATHTLTPYLHHLPPIEKGRVELIVLKEAKKRKGAKKRRIDYDDTPETIRMREFLERYNAYLDRSIIWLDEEGLGLIKSYDAVFDFEQKTTYRVFNDGSFDLGGRFYGGWWVSAPEEIRKHILIDGHPTIEYDYKALHVYLLYGTEGLQCPMDDPYLLPGLEERRKDVKQVVTISLCAGSRASTCKAAAGKGVKGAKLLLDAFYERHTPIFKYAYSGIGKELQRKDSELAEFILQRGLDAGLPVLCVHDSFIGTDGPFIKELMYGAGKAIGLNCNLMID